MITVEEIKRSNLESLKKYLGKINEEDILEKMNEWYSSIMTSNHEQVVFLSDNAYMMALAFESINGVSMEESSKANFYTLSSFSQEVYKLAKCYVETSQFPKTLICDILISHAGDINWLVDYMLKNILNVLKENFHEKVKEEQVEISFMHSINLYFLGVNSQNGIVFENDALCLKVRKIKAYTQKEMNELLNRITNCIKFLDRPNSSYNCYEVLKGDEITIPDDSTRTIYLNKIEYSYIDPIYNGDDVKAILSLRLIKSDWADDVFCIVPFTFLPNLSGEETKNLWDNIKKEILNKKEKISEDFVAHMDKLEQLDGKILFNQYLILLFNYAILTDFNEKNGIDFVSGDLFQNKVNALVRNFGVEDREKAKRYLDAIFRQKYLTKEKLCQLLQACITKERILYSIKEDSCTNKTRNLLEQMEHYCYNTAIRAKIESRKLGQKRKIQGLCFTIEDIFQRRTKASIKEDFSYLLQLMDANMLDVSFIPSNRVRVIGFAEFSRPGDMALFIYPNRYKKFFPVMVEMKHFVNKLEWGDWTIYASIFFEKYSSEIDSLTAKGLEEFMKKMKDGYEEAEDWLINWDTFLPCYNNDFHRDKIVRIGEGLDLSVGGTRQLRAFDEWKNKIFNPDDFYITIREEYQKKLKNKEG